VRTPQIASSINCWTCELRIPRVRLIYPLPRGVQRRFNAVHETAGLPGYLASDFFAAAGTVVLAVESGRIHKLSGHDPADGPTNGIHGPFGWSIYLLGEDGTDFYYTHLGTRRVTLGQHVVLGQIIGTVGDYARWGGVNHTHIGAHGPTAIERIMGAQQVSR